MTLIHDEALTDRADVLAVHGCNGIDRLVVRLEPAAAPTRAVVDVLFHNVLHVAAILADPGDPRSRVKITGGRRRRGGEAPGEVQVTAITAGEGPTSLRVAIEPIGDFSTYRLAVLHPGMDPVFAEAGFRFRPGCFTTNCTPRLDGRPRPAGDPGIDYTAKDYASFRHTLIAAMARRMPGWAPTSEADLTQLMIDYLAAAADELSDYQDRVVNERSLSTARKRVSIARHARLVDYHIHQGNQASTWLALEVGAGTDLTLPAGLVASTADGQPFQTRTDRRVLGALDAMALYTWGGVRPGLDQGATSADLALSAADAALVASAIASGQVAELVIWEARDPATGRLAVRDPEKRQLLRLVPPAIAGVDPITSESYLRVTWRPEDALRAPYCATLSPPGGPEITGISLVSGNLAYVHHGHARTLTFVPPGEARGDEPAWLSTRWGTLCALPHDAPLLYRDTPPGGEVPPVSTIELAVVTDASEDTSWQEDISLVHARPHHRVYAVETDELGRSVIRFGTGDNGTELPDHGRVRVTWQAGEPLAGNVGADAIRRCDDPRILRCWNPFDVTGARAPEPREQIIRRAPEAFRARQLRWVTLADVIARAEEVPGVARAAARYVWTGSWTAIRLTIDPANRHELDDDLRRRVADHLTPVALLGDDLEIRGPRYVPLEIAVVVCVAPDVWREHVRAEIEDELSSGHTADGRLGLFHPDRWTFGQVLHASQVIGRIQRVPGVAHVVSVDLQRYREPTPGPRDRIEVAANEIIEVHNDPSDMERGLVTIELEGGRG